MASSTTTTPATPTKTARQKLFELYQQHKNSPLGENYFDHYMAAAHEELANVRDDKEVFERERKNTESAKPDHKRFVLQLIAAHEIRQQGDPIKYNTALQELVKLYVGNYYYTHSFAKNLMSEVGKTWISHQRFTEAADFCALVQRDQPDLYEELATKLTTSDDKTIVPILKKIIEFCRRHYHPSDNRHYSSNGRLLYQCYLKLKEFEPIEALTFFLQDQARCSSYEYEPVDFWPFYNEIFAQLPETSRELCDAKSEKKHALASETEKTLHAIMHRDSDKILDNYVRLARLLLHDRGSERDYPNYLKRLNYLIANHSLSTKIDQTPAVRAQFEALLRLWIETHQADMGREATVGTLILPCLLYRDVNKRLQNIALGEEEDRYNLKRIIPGTWSDFAAQTFLTHWKQSWLLTDESQYLDFAKRYYQLPRDSYQTIAKQYKQRMIAINKLYKENNRVEIEWRPEEKAHQEAITHELQELNALQSLSHVIKGMVGIAPKPTTKNLQPFLEFKSNNPILVRNIRLVRLYQEENSYMLYMEANSCFLASMLAFYSHAQKAEKLKANPAEYTIAVRTLCLLSQRLFADVLPDSDSESKEQFDPKKMAQCCISNLVQQPTIIHCMRDIKRKLLTHLQVVQDRIDKLPPKKEGDRENSDIDRLRKLKEQTIPLLMEQRIITATELSTPLPSGSNREAKATELSTISAHVAHALHSTAMMSTTTTPSTSAPVKKR